MMLIKITRESVKFIRSNIYSRALYKYECTCLNKQIHTSQGNITLRLLRSINALNSKLKLKTILINKLQLFLKALHLEATLTFLRFAAKHYSIAQLFGVSYQPYTAHSKLCGGKLFRRKSKPLTMSERQH